MPRSTELGPLPVCLRSLPIGDSPATEQPAASSSSLITSRTLTTHNDREDVGNARRAISGSPSALRLGRPRWPRDRAAHPSCPTFAPCHHRRDERPLPRRRSRAETGPLGRGAELACPHRAAGSTRPRTLPSSRSCRRPRWQPQSGRRDPNGGRPVHHSLLERKHSRQQSISLGDLGMDLHFGSTDSTAPDTRIPRSHACN